MPRCRRPRVRITAGTGRRRYRGSGRRRGPAGELSPAGRPGLNRPPAPRLGRGLSSVISGTIVAPFIALVVTLIYYRLSANAQVPTAPGENYGGYGQTPLQRIRTTPGACR